MLVGVTTKLEKPETSQQHLIVLKKINKIKLATCFCLTFYVWYEVEKLSV